MKRPAISTGGETHLYLMTSSIGTKIGVSNNPWRRRDQLRTELRKHVSEEAAQSLELVRVFRLKGDHSIWGRHKLVCMAEKFYQGKYSGNKVVDIPMFNGHDEFFDVPWEAVSGKIHATKKFTQEFEDYL